MTVTVRLRWNCVAAPHLAHCDASGTGPRSDSQASKHLRVTGHAVATIGEPEEDRK